MVRASGSSSCRSTLRRVRCGDDEPAEDHSVVFFETSVVEEPATWAFQVRMPVVSSYFASENMVGVYASWSIVLIARPTVGSFRRAIETSAPALRTVVARAGEENAESTRRSRSRPTSRLRSTSVRRVYG